MSLNRWLCLGLASWLSLLFGASVARAAAPCGGGDAAIELRVVATALAPEADRTLTLRVFDDGCAQVHRPAYRRDAGDYRLDLDAAALTALRHRVDQPALQGFDAKRVQTDIATAQRQRTRADGQAQRHSELDGDRYEIHWRSGSKRSAVAWTGLPGHARAYPDNAALKAFHGAAIALQALAENSDALRIAGGRP